MEEPSMRGIVFRESLVAGSLPAEPPATVARRYRYLLDGTFPVEVIELRVAARAAPALAMRLAEALHPARYYAHIVGADRMYVIFPSCVAIVRRGDAESAGRAQEVGRRFGIPMRQMRFLEMFEIDHPDALPPAGKGAG
ncbi:MAG TPA: hypothetical protein VH912_04100 [Streptosporangiaceae bacterium]